MQRAVGSRAEKKAICVVTSTHFSIGASERSDAPGSSDFLWEGEGKWRREVMEKEGEVVGDGAQDLEDPCGPGIGAFLLLQAPGT